MARMLGRFEEPGCCPGARSGWTRRRRLYGPDCSGAGTSTRRRKRLEQREFVRSLLRDDLGPDDVWERMDRRVLELLDEQLLAFAESSLPLAVEALNLIDADP